eukprot:gene14235-biopygen12622
MSNAGDVRRCVRGGLGSMASNSPCASMWGIHVHCLCCPATLLLRRHHSSLRFHAPWLRLKLGLCRLHRLRNAGPPAPDELWVSILREERGRGGGGVSYLV